MAEPLRKSFEAFVDRVTGGTYPEPEHDYVMPPEEKAKFIERLEDILPF
jgi:hypothetical protein